MTGFESAQWSADGGGEGPIVTFVPTTGLIVAGVIVLLVVLVRSSVTDMRPLDIARRRVAHGTRIAVVV